MMKEEIAMMILISIPLMNVMQMKTKISTSRNSYLSIRRICSLLLVKKKMKAIKIKSLWEILYAIIEQI